MTNSLYLRLLTYVKPYWKQFAAGIIGMVILAATETAIAAMLKPLLDGSFVEKDPGYMFWMPFIMITVFAIRGISTFTSTIAMAWVGNKVVLDLRKKMFSICLSLCLLSITAPLGINSAGADNSSQVVPQISPPFQIWDDAGQNSNPAVAYNPLRDEFFVVWSTMQDEFSTDIGCNKSCYPGFLFEPCRSSCCGS